MTNANNVFIYDVENAREGSIELIGEDILIRYARYKSQGGNSYATGQLAIKMNMEEARELKKRLDIILLPV